ncbi:CoA transferase [Rhodococcus sp. T2V]|uniref:CaiB/BaiF CoA transferase family protein n=1 Tax=Rhodococcus sp. T2V TaxID=3034164 RepID=UPI0023E1975A|nr:CoA transferase [Rhodococcus sp. T2V]MDF3309686.1 CoA transferase [Rhodococcus sp. T2V]
MGNSFQQVEDRTMNKPLQGVRILDLTHWWSGPEATLVLAALGADVIKIEAVQRPDSARALRARDIDTDPYWFERGSVYNGANAGKRGITLDLSRPAGRDIFVRLLPDADVVINNFSARVMSNLGFSHEDLVALNPRLVTVDMTSFGLTGPWRDLVGFAYVFEQLSGAAALTGYEDGPPATLGGASDPTAGYVGALAVLAGLEARDATGRAQHFDISQTEAMAAFLGAPMIEAQVTGREPERRGNRHPEWAPHGVYRCEGDDEWVAIAVRDDAEWSHLVEVLGRPEWALDERLATRAGRKAHENLLDERIDDWCASRAKESVAAVLWAAGVPSGELVDAFELESEPQLVDRGTFQSMAREPIGDIAVPVVPLRMSGTDLSFTRPAPRLGEHTGEVLQELLGLTDDDLADLEEAAIIGTAPA